MWSLQAMNKDVEVHMLADVQYTIGRKDADIVISDDSSVSRRHGTICITPDTSSSSFAVIVTDTSKFGLFYKRNAQEDGSEGQYTKVNKIATLQEGDIIRVGVQRTFFKLKRQALSVITSMIDLPSQERLREIISKLGGKVISKWSSDVTHLVMDSIILNIKVTQALASACPIVTEDFFSKLLEAITKKQSLPQSNDCVPTIVEEGLDKKECSFVPNALRNSVFNGRTFVFFNKKQMKRLGLTCTLAGATTHLIGDIQSQDIDKLLTKPGTAFLLFGKAPDSQLCTEQRFMRIQQIMVEKKLRFIQEHEIGLALLYCSGDVYSNPEFDLSSENTFTQRTIPGATFSQDGMENSIDLEREVSNEGSLQPESLFVSRIPETERLDTCPETIRDSEHVSKKRSHDISDDMFEMAGQTPAKSIKLDKSEVVILSDDDEDLFSDLGVGTSKRQTTNVKPAPKRHKESQGKLLVKAKLTDGIAELSPKTEISTSVSSSTNPAEPHVVKYEDVEMEEFPNSCIDDDSLWTCKSEPDASVISKDNNQQKDYNYRSDLAGKEAVDSKVILAAPRTSNHNKGHTSASHKHNQVKNNNNMSEKDTFNGHEAKVAFVPSSVPEDSIKDESNDDTLDYAGLCKIVLIPLIRKQSSVAKNDPSQTKSNSHGKVNNFKKFVKILPTYKSGGSQTNVHSEEIPQIIGGRDLVAHVNSIERSSTFNEWGQAEDFPESQSQDSNPFYDLLKKKAARKA